MWVVMICMNMLFITSLWFFYGEYFYNMVQVKSIGRKPKWKVISVF